MSIDGLLCPVLTRDIVQTDHKWRISYNQIKKRDRPDLKVTDEMGGMKDNENIRPIVSHIS